MNSVGQPAHLGWKDRSTSKGTSAVTSVAPSGSSSCATETVSYRSMTIVNDTSQMLGRLLGNAQVGRAAKLTCPPATDAPRQHCNLRWRPDLLLHL